MYKINITDIAQSTINATNYCLQYVTLQIKTSQTSANIKE